MVLTSRKSPSATSSYVPAGGAAAAAACVSVFALAGSCKLRGSMQQARLPSSDSHARCQTVEKQMDGSARTVALALHGCPLPHLFLQGSSRG